MSETNPLHRRRFMLGGAGAAAAAGLAALGETAIAQAMQAKPLPDYAQWKDADDMIVHSGLTLETRRGAFGPSVITPNELLFLRNNLPPPADAVADPDAWQVSIEGVRGARTLRVGDLKRMGLSTVASVLQCSGNGRGFFEHKTSGSQWKVGAAGCVIWTGVPIAELVRELGGVNGGMRFMTGTGAEALPAGVDPKSIMVERSVPLEAMQDALLAWELNGEPLPLAHGGPLRLIVPGYYGVNNVKYIKRLAFTPAETDAKIQASGYRVRAIGDKGAPSQPSMWEMNVKSWIQNPSGDGTVPAGSVQIYGVAFAGTRAVREVEVSIDGGRRWMPARFIGPDLGRYAWRQFVLPLRLAPGDYMVASRATDVMGNTQPELRAENHRGYGHNGWRDHAVALKVV